MNIAKHAKRVDDLYREFRRIFSPETREAKVKQGFRKILGVYEKRRFPDLTYLEHTLQAVHLVQGDTIWSLPLACAIWYQHRAKLYKDRERSVAFARKELPLLGVSDKDVETTAALIRGITAPDPQGFDALLLADANIYAHYGVSWHRTTEIVVLEAKQDGLTHDYLRKVVAKELSSLLSGKIYYSGMVRERFDAPTRQNIKDTLFNIGYVAKDSPKRNPKRLELK